MYIRWASERRDLGRILFIKKVQVGVNSHYFTFMLFLSPDSHNLLFRMFKDLSSKSNCCKFLRVKGPIICAFKWILERAVVPTIKKKNLLSPD